MAMAYVAGSTSQAASQFRLPSSSVPQSVSTVGLALQLLEQQCEVEQELTAKAVKLSIKIAGAAM
jgi:hypothetical protein